MRVAYASANRSGRFTLDRSGEGGQGGVALATEGRHDLPGVGADLQLFELAVADTQLPQFVTVANSGMVPPHYQGHAAGTLAQLEMDANNFRPAAHHESITFTLEARQLRFELEPRPTRITLETRELTVILPERRLSYTLEGRPLQLEQPERKHDGLAPHFSPLQDQAG